VHEISKEEIKNQKNRRKESVSEFRSWLGGCEIIQR